MSPPDSDQINHRHHRYPNGATLLSAAWRVGAFFVGRATVIRPNGTVVGRFLTANGNTLDDVHEQLILQGQNTYKEP